MSTAAERLKAILADPVETEITKCKLDFLLDQPFLGQIITRLETIEAPWCRTGATDGRHLYWNREFMKGLTRDQKLFFFAHEVYHIIFDHVGRRGSRDPEIFNMACDFNINYSLVKEHIGEPIANMLYDERYTSDMSAYEIYDLLIENSTEIELTLDEHLEVNNGPDDEKDGSGSGDGESQEGEGEGEGEGKGKKKAKIRVLGKDGKPRLTNEDLDKFRREVRAAVIAAAQYAGSDRIPAGLKKMINNLLEPKLDWRSMLDAYIRSSIKDDYSFQNLSRRSWASGAILPGQKFSERVEVFAAIDASGSTTAEMVTDFLSELTGIVSDFPDYKIDLISFDTEVYNHVVITPENQDELYKYEIQGNGGTLFECVYEYMKREGIEPERLVILTDGLPNSSWGDPNYCDTIFIIHSNPHIIAPYGMSCAYEERTGKR